MLVAPAVRLRSSRRISRDRVFAIVEGIPNDEPPEAQKLEEEFRGKFGNGLAIWISARLYNEMRMLVQAIKDANSDER